MKTDNIYIAELAYFIRKQQEGDLRDYYFGKGMVERNYFHPIKYVIVKKETSGSRMAKDLENGKRYMCQVPTDAGTLYLPSSKMLPFDSIYPDEKRNLSKKKILMLGKQAIEEFKKIKDEQKNK